MERLSEISKVLKLVYTADRDRVLHWGDQTGFPRILDPPDCTFLPYFQRSDSWLNLPYLERLVIASTMTGQGGMKKCH